MPDLSIYRKRLIPDECFKLNDEVLFWDKSMLVTNWKSIHPRPDLDHGCSVYYLDRGYKISRFYSRENELLYHYCDIITHTYSEEENKLVVIDLLADVIVENSGRVRVIDLDEIAEALDLGILPIEWCKIAMRAMNELLGAIYGGKLEELGEPLRHCNNRCKNDPLGEGGIKVL